MTSKSKYKEHIKVLQQPDWFLGHIKPFFTKLSKNTPLLISLAVLASIAVLGTFGMLYWNGKKQLEASEAFSKAHQVFEAETKKTNEESSPAEVDTTKLEVITHDYKNTNAAYEAGILLSNYWFNKKDFSKSKQWAEVAAQSAQSNLDATMTQYMIALSLESANQLDQALDAFQKINLKEVPYDFIRGEALLGLIRIALKQKNINQAQAYFDEFKNSFSQKRNFQGLDYYDNLIKILAHELKSDKKSPKEG